MFALSAAELEALKLSLRVALWCVAFSLPAGILVAWVLARLDFPGCALLDGIVHLPLVLPPVVVGYGLLLVLGQQGPVGSWLYDTFGITVAFTWKGAVVASAIMGFPLMVRAIRLSIEAVDPGLEAAARTLGAGPFNTFMTITLPLAWPGILTGMVLAFARSLGEFGATITFVSNIPGETRTLPLALFGLTQVPGSEDAALRLVVISIVLAFAALIASEVTARRIRKRMGG
ncbi:MAG: molybdate ABC transporter permease subunit [Rhodospirillales bacterium]|nr:molybdate ABC transporter permease subunit [Rhodospirillales bacterium]MBT4007027.1 molybdate ABC transporter permease subunit [Rhodospirillales bacterium]MBT5076093.1 molybdate ABC transporter permease subunit [Rhodospirillales bacterium]MBT5112887.1 molybdate ABC transporter permease subunit [Rhodospirillales bacterium]MBT5673658.1 molybdate ABC transporter permease subunit [Rhodospirillales bacterium]